jgi:hypothetical protein
VNTTEEDARLLARAGGWDGQELTAAGLGAVAQEHGLDFATALLYRHVSQIPANAEFLRVAQAGQFPPSSDVLVGVVPGAFHREHRLTGADGGRVLAIARDLGIAAELIPTASFGALAENALIILEWLAARRGSRVALVSLSKGGADVKRALSMPGATEVFANVAAWISLSGTVQGTPLIEWFRRRPVRWWAIRFALRLRGQPGRTLEELCHGPATLLGTWPPLPAQTRIVHVCGFPLERHLVHPWAPRAFARLAPLGPNDGGGNLLADALNYPGIVCPVWGADHYLSPRWDATPVLTGIIAAALAPRQASQSANQPSAPPASKSSA